jgi:hypothetical protein
VPASFGQLGELTILNLSHTQVNGTLPDAMRGCKKMKEMHLRDTHLTGAIPHTLFQYMYQLTELDMSVSNAMQCYINCVFNPCFFLSFVPALTNTVASSSVLVPLKHNPLLHGGLSSHHDSVSSFRCLTTTPFHLFFRSSHGSLTNTIAFPSFPLQHNPLMHGGTSSHLDDNTEWPVSRRLPPRDLAVNAKLQVLRLTACNLAGSLPFEWKRLNKLRHLSLDNNALTGRLPPLWYVLRALPFRFAVQSTRSNLIIIVHLSSVFSSGTTCTFSRRCAWRTTH